MIENNKKIRKVALKINLTLQNVIIVFLLLSYLVIFYAYKYDIDQYKDIVENPQELCYIYYNNLMKTNQQELQQPPTNETERNISKIVSDMFISE